MAIAAEKYLAPDVFCVTSESKPIMRHEEQVARMIEGGARYIEFSDRTLSRDEFRLTAERCATICRWAGVFFSISGWPDLAPKIRCHGVHLVPQDPSAKEIRNLVGNETLIGRSAFSLEELKSVLSTPIDYLFLGPIFPTQSYSGLRVLGLEVVRKAVELLENDHRPLILFGGITLDRLAKLRRVAPQSSLAIQTLLTENGSVSTQVQQFRRHWALSGQSLSC